MDAGSLYLDNPISMGETILIGTSEHLMKDKVSLGVVNLCLLPGLTASPMTSLSELFRTCRTSPTTR